MLKLQKSGDIVTDQPKHFLDITAEVCPFTFVKTKLLIERMQQGDLLQVRLQGVEPLRNVPRAAAELGHVILSLQPERSEDPAGPYLLLLKKV